MVEVCSYCGEKGHSIQQCPKWKGGEVASATKDELTPYMQEKIPLILSKLREAQKTMMVSKETLYDWVHPYVTKVAFDEIIAYLERKGEIFEPRPGFLKTTESSSSPERTMRGVVAELVRRDVQGNRVESELVFRPECEWFIPKLGDTLGEISFTTEGFVKEFGAEILARVMKGEIVKVEAKASSDMVYRGCPLKSKPWRRTSFKTVFPFEGTQETLSRTEQHSSPEPKRVYVLPTPLFAKVGEHSPNPFVYIEDIDYHGQKLPLYAVNGDLAVKDPVIGYINVSETSKMPEREVPKHLMYLREKHGMKKSWTEILDKLFESVASGAFVTYDVFKSWLKQQGMTIEEFKKLPPPSKDLIYGHFKVKIESEVT